MSMHEIEGLVEESVRVLESVPEKSPLDLRSICWNLFRYQGQFDTGNTLFRVIDILLKEHYIYSLPISAHPNYEKYKDYFNNLTGFTDILRSPTEKWDAKQNPGVGGYVVDVAKEWGENFAREVTQPGPLLYVEAGSELWKDLVEKGVLTGKDAEPPVMQDMVELIETIVNIAIKNSHKDLAAWWYKVGIPYEVADLGVEACQQNSHLNKIREVAKENKLMDIEVYGYNEDMLESLQDEFNKWWFA